MSGAHTPTWAVRKARYGRVPFEVVQIVKESDKSHTVLSKEWNGTWEKRAWLTRAPFEGYRASSEVDADAMCAAGNAAWGAREDFVAAAKLALKDAISAQLESAEAAIAKATTAIESNSVGTPQGVNQND